MKISFIAIILALAICFPAFMLSRNSEIEELECRIQQVEREIAILQNRFKTNNANIQTGLLELKGMLIEYNWIIAVSGGFLGVREE